MDFRTAMTFLTRFIIGAILLVFSVDRAVAESAVSIEWKQRLTQALRKQIATEGSGPLESAPESGSSPLVQETTATEETPTILNTLTSLLTQATTETYTFSREMAPAFEWPGRFLEFPYSSGRSWRERLRLFQPSDEATGDSTPETSISPTVPVPETEEEPR